MSGKRLRSPHVWQPSDPIQGNAQFVLPAMVRDYFAAGRKLVATNPDPEDMHPFRLATKRFRYTLEIFREVYGPSMDEKLELLKPVQNALGDINDCVATEDEFGGNKTFDTFLNDLAVKKTRKFCRSWKSTFDAQGQEEMWVTYLSGETQPPVDSENLAGHEVRSR